MSSPNDAARRALLLDAIEAWADSRDAFTLAQMDERVRPSEQTRERTARAGADVKRSRVLMLEGIEAFAGDCRREGAFETYTAIREAEEGPGVECELCEQEAELEPGTFTPHEHAGVPTVKP